MIFIFITVAILSFFAGFKAAHHPINKGGYQPDPRNGKLDKNNPPKQNLVIVRPKPIRPNNPCFDCGWAKWNHRNCYGWYCWESGNPVNFIGIDKAGCKKWKWNGK